MMQMHRFTSSLCTQLIVGCLMNIAEQSDDFA